MDPTHRQGGCHCGFVRYQIDGDALRLAVCHCKACQRQSASAFGMSLAVPDGAFRLLSGRLSSFEMICDSGRTKTCAFCPECGTRIYNRTGAGTSVKAGSLDDTSDLVPEAHYWTKQKQRWVEIPATAIQFEDDG